ncbi:MAG: VanW family protein [Actinomycetota bacterium]
MVRHREHSNGWLWVLPALVIPLVISAIAWTAHVSSEGNEIAPNVKFAGVDLSGLSPDVAAAHVGWRETAFLDTPVTIDLGETSVTMPAREIGFDYLYEDTVAAVVSARHGDGAIDEFVSWVRTPFEPVTVRDRFTLEKDRARERLSAEEFVLETPVEPELTEENGFVTVVPGEPGTGIDVDWAIEALEVADIVSGPVTIEARLDDVPPSVSDEKAHRVAERANELTEDDFIAAVRQTTGRLSPEQVRTHLWSHVEKGEMWIEVDVAGLQRDLEALFPEPQGSLAKPELEVVDGEVEVKTPGVPPPICCSEESVRAAAERLLHGGDMIYILETRPNDDPTLVAWSDGSQVTEVVAEFTTSHACCENRVVNIQTMADRLRGYYMLPGETLSFNDYVGQRTREKGYLPAGAIRSGHMTDEVGGGVSQFTTTMFNAAFFAGLDLDEYQSHSVYFSRYPYGREATLSMPGPDLVLTNSTDYPVLIWPTYDETSITVSLYSTKHIDVTEVDHRIFRRGQCRHSQIDRQRTYPNGPVKVDTIIANYRPADGIDCNGNQIPPPP